MHRCLFALFLGAVCLLLSGSCAVSDIQSLGTQPPADEKRAVEATYEYIAATYPEMLEAPNSVHVTSVSRSRNGRWHIRLDHYFGDARVYGAESTADLLPNLTMNWFDAGFISGLDLVFIPGIGLDDAVRIGLDHQVEINGHGEEARDQELVVFFWDDSHMLCWRFFLINESRSARWEYFVDARDGYIVYYRNRIIY